MHMDDSDYQARAARLRAMACALVRHLGANVWHVDTGRSHEHSARLVSGNLELWIANNSSKRGMYHVSGDHASPDSHKHRPYNVGRPEINVSQDKTPAQIARDIERRLLPDTRTLAAEIQKSIDAANAHVSLTAKTAQALATATGGEVTPANPYRGNDGHSAEVTFRRILPGSYIDAKVTGAGVTIERLSLTAEQAAIVIKALAKVWTQTDDE